MSSAPVGDDCLKLTTFFGERQRAGDLFLADALAGLYGEHEVAGSIVLRGAEGFGLKHHLRTDDSLTLSEDLPLMSIAVDRRARLESLVPKVADLGPGLVTLERARLLTGDPGPAAVDEGSAEATKLTVYLGRQERAGSGPAFIAICQALHRHGVAGATAFLGVDGTWHGRRQRATFFSRNAEVPMMVVSVGDGLSIGRALPEVLALLSRPLVTLERAQVCKRDGRRLSSPQCLPGSDEHGLALWQKLTIYTSESTQYQGVPVHRAITRRLRAAGASGATSVRGVWGFHGDHPPRGDRLFQLGRRVPVVTVVIDTPQRVAGAFAIVDELTGQAGLVTSETIPAMRAASRERHHGGLHLAHWHP